MQRSASYRRRTAQALALVLVATLRLSAQQQTVALPPVNLGATTFIDAIAFPGWLTEEIGQAQHQDRSFDADGQQLATATNANIGSSLTHIAWISHHRVLGAWYGAEVLFSAAYIDTGGHGISQGFGDMTVGPLLLQWPKRSLLGRPLYQRVLFDMDLPTGKYSRDNAVNVSSHTWDVHPYYALTWQLAPRVETSWRVHYLWNAANDDPATATGLRRTQAGQAIHCNGAVSYELGKHVFLGPAGYYLGQITDARVNGAALPNSRQQVGGLGAGVMVRRGSWFYYANGYDEIGAKNTSAGERFVLRVERVF